jgi:two-component system, LytTR family, response regulator
MIRAIIIEDEKDSRAILAALLTKYCEGIDVVGEAENVREGVKLINLLSPDLVFLDIEMPFENGFQLFKYFEEVNFDVIFTTAYDEYALKAFRFAALDYLLKPINLEELREAIKRVNKEENQVDYNNVRIQTLAYNLDHNFQKIALPILNGLVFVDIDDIFYLEADNNYTTVHTTGGKHLVSRTLREYETILGEVGFFRINRSHLINMKFLKSYIKSTPPSVELTNGTKLKLSSSRKKDFLGFIGQ